MKNINFKNIPFQIILALLFATQWVQAQPVFTDDVQDVPIDDYVMPGIILMGLYLLFIVYRKKKQSQELK